MTEGEELWRQVALRMWGRLMGGNGGGSGGGGVSYDSTAVGLGVPGMGFRDAVRSMVGGVWTNAFRVCVFVT